MVKNEYEKAASDLDFRCRFIDSSSVSCRGSKGRVSDRIEGR